MEYGAKVFSPDGACVLAHLQTSYHCQVIAADENADSGERGCIRLQEDEVEIFEISVSQTLMGSQDQEEEKSMGK